MPTLDQRRFSTRAIPLMAICLGSAAWIGWLLLERDKTRELAGHPAGRAPAPVDTTPERAAGGTRQPISQADLVRLTVVDDRSLPVVGANVTLLALDNGSVQRETSTSAGAVNVPPGVYVASIQGEGVVDSFGPCDLTQDRTLAIERAASIELLFVAGGFPRSDVRAKLLLESPWDGRGNTIGVTRAALRDACFAREQPAARARSLAAQVERDLTFGWVADTRLAEQASDVAGRISWNGLPSGTHRWQLLSGERVALEPPYEVPQFSETPRGSLEINAIQRGLSGAFRAAPGERISFRQEILPGSRVSGVVLAEGARPVEHARVTLCTLARSKATGDVSIAPEAYARTGPEGTFLFENVAPGAKMAFAILDRSDQGHFWVTNDSADFELAEGEERDLGVLSMDGAVVELRVRFAGREGREYSPAEVIEEERPRVHVCVGNGIGPAQAFSAQFLAYLGESTVYTLHGLTPLVSLSLVGGSGDASGRPWTLRPGFREDESREEHRRFDPYAEPRVVLDIPIEEVTPCELLVTLPAGAALELQTGVHGKATRVSDRRRFSIDLEQTGNDAFSGRADLPEGRYEVLLVTGLPDEHPGFFVRGWLEIPCSGRQEWSLERGVCVSGSLVDEHGAPRRRGVRVGFSSARRTEFWTIARPDAEGRFTVCAVPPDSTLVFEGSSDTVHVGAADLAGVRVFVREP